MPFHIALALNATACSTRRDSLGGRQPSLASFEVWCEGEKGDLPAPTPLEILAANPNYQGGVWMLLDVDTTKLDTTPVRLNISLPQSLVNEIDAYAKAQGATRSGFLAKAARAAMGAGLDGIP
jgi:HicB_like antitoxin of bacterial toxin-antitoxin system